MSAETEAHGQALEQELPWLRSLARRLATDDADDLVHETWIRAQGARPGRSRLRPWLGTILRNSHRMTRRAARARERRESAQLEADPTSIEKVVAARELYALIDELLGELDDEARFVIRQRYVADRSAVEIAEELDVPAATVRTRLRRALQRLRSRLDERCGGRPAWAMVAAGTELPRWGVVIVMKAALGTSLVAAVAAGVLWFTGGRGIEPSRAAGESGSEDSPRVKAPGRSEATPSRPWERDPTWAERTQKRDALRRRIGDALASEEDSEERVELPSVEMSVSVGQAVASCSELLEPHDTGRVSLAFHYLGAPGIGVIVDDVTVDADDLGREAFTECLAASATLAELDAPDQPIEGTFRAHYTAGEKPNNMRLFLAANPELAEQFEAFAELLGRGDEGVDDALASRLAETVTAHPELADRFEQWVIEDGLELSVFRPE